MMAHIDPDIRVIRYPGPKSRHVQLASLQGYFPFHIPLLHAITSDLFSNPIVFYPAGNGKDLHH
jgi:hypothetical protein